MFFLFIVRGTYAQMETRTRVSFNKDWKFRLGETPGASAISFDDKDWREAWNLPA